MISIRNPSKRLLTGYHYTSLENWKSIKKQGLIPYFIKHPGLLYLFPEGFTGIWVFEKELDAIPEQGILLERIGRQQTVYPIKLQVKYQEKDLLVSPRGSFHINHTMNMQNFTLIENSAVRIVQTVIKPKHIKLLKTFDYSKYIRLERTNDTRVSHQEATETQE